MVGGAVATLGIKKPTDTEGKNTTVEEKNTTIGTIKKYKPYRAINNGGSVSVSPSTNSTSSRSAAANKPYQESYGWSDRELQQHRIEEFGVYGENHFNLSDMMPTLRLEYYPLPINFSDPSSLADHSRAYVQFNNIVLLHLVSDTVGDHYKKSHTIEVALQVNPSDVDLLTKLLQDHTVLKATVHTLINEGESDDDSLMIEGECYIGRIQPAWMEQGMPTYLVFVELVSTSIKGFKSEWV
jgi:hypothetical protein